MQVPLHERIETLLAPVAAREGYELVAVETAGATKAPLVRVLLDRDGGLDIDAIVAANGWISEVLDAEDPIPSGYTLEVSTPGIDRPLRKIEDFERFIGSTAVMKTRTIEGRTRFTGIITAVEDEVIVLDIDGQTFRVPFASVSKANIKGDVDFNQKKGADD
ncbi:MAG: ribosome maturation factor RimP [Coriobacteriia bacterium]|nr:ribosome maturation factor RimP [Coriobacteriia bacterium]